MSATTCGTKLIVIKMPAKECLISYRLIRNNRLTSKRLPEQSVSSKRNHQVTDKFRKVSCLNVYGRKRGRQTIHAFLPSIVINVY